MAYTHLTRNELISLEEYFLLEKSVTEISRKLNRSRQTIHNVISYLRKGR